MDEIWLWTGSQMGGPNATFCPYKSLTCNKYQLELQEEHLPQGLTLNIIQLFPIIFYK